MRAIDSSLPPQRHKSQTTSGEGSGEGSGFLCASGIHIRASHWNGVSRFSVGMHTVSV